jgi:hypothetical protein
MSENYLKIGGFAMLIAVLVSGLFLAIGATIYRIALIEIILSSTGRDSHLAFYSADSGAECALYWNFNYSNSFSGDTTDGTGSAFHVGKQIDPTDPIEYADSNRQRIIANSNFNSPALNTIQCLTNPDNTPMNITLYRAKLPDETGGADTDTAFELNSSFICARVLVKKLFDASNNKPKTEIISRGYSTCDTTNPRRVERAIKVTIE